MTAETLNMVGTIAWFALLVLIEREAGFFTGLGFIVITLALIIIKESK